jgi:hypothetical protein
MFNAIPANWILDYATSIGAYVQLELDLGTPPWVFVRPEDLTSITVQTSIYSSQGKKSGAISSIDHPSFSKTKEQLVNSGYIEEAPWINGDTVLKPFYFNNVLLDVGDKFLCASALGYRKEFTSNYNNGVPDVTVKNYRGKL